MAWYTNITVYFTVKPNYTVYPHRLYEALPIGRLNVMPAAIGSKVQVSSVTKYGDHSDLLLLCHQIRKVVGDKNLIELEGDIRGEDWYAQSNMRLAEGEGEIHWKFDGSMAVPPIDRNNTYDKKSETTTVFKENGNMYADEDSDEDIDVSSTTAIPAMIDLEANKPTLSSIRAERKHLMNKAIACIVFAAYAALLYFVISCTKQ